MTTLKATKLLTIQMGHINYVYLSKDEHTPNDTFISINKNIFQMSKHDNINVGFVGLSSAQREFLCIDLGESLKCDYVPISKIPNISVARFNIEMLNLGKKELNRKYLLGCFKSTYVNFPFNIGQVFYFHLEEVTYKISCIELISLPMKTNSNSKILVADDSCGVLVSNTNIYFTSNNDKLTLIGQDDDSVLHRHDFSFEDLGIGGLKKEFGIMFRRAFVQRIFDPDTIQKLGIQHVKGILLFGPPGTGKTLIARQIGKLLNAKEPKIVNGPEILNKYVGQSEENIRNLFKDAEEDFKKYKEKSSLHVIIFDELDAIFKSRGTSTSNIGDQVVNQLLSKMDGVEALDNVLIIGMTNRPDLIDNALLRPGRFEIHIEISLPNEEGRYEIFRIHTNEMKKSGYLCEDVKLDVMSKITRNYTGAEIAALVKSAVSYALERQVTRKKDKDTDELRVNNEIKITMNDFMTALDEVKPSFGYREDDFYSHSKIHYELPSFTNAANTATSFITKLKSTTAYTTSSFLFYGPPGTGKSTLAIRTALHSKFPFIKLVSPKNLVGYSEPEKVNYIKTVFMDAYKSEQSIVILDDIEGLLDYVSIGPRFNNSVLQTLKIFIKNEEKNKLMVIATSSEEEILNEMGIFDCFYGTSHIGYINKDEFEILKGQESAFNQYEFTGDVPIKHLLAQLEGPTFTK